MQPMFGTLGGFGQPGGFAVPVQQTLPQIDPNEALYQSVFQCHKYGDDRDVILANFNYLQACLGAGKGYYSQTLPPVTYTPSNPYYRCKAVGYSFMFTNNNEEGLVSFEMKKAAEKIRLEETAVISILQCLLNRPNIIFKMAGVKRVSEEQSIVNVYAEDQATLRRIPATELAAAINQPHLKAQFDTWGICNIFAKVRPSPQQLKEYLENAPEGIDSRVWKQAHEDNPDPENMIPTPVIGVDALKKRIHAQETESEHHSARLLLIQEECAQYQSRCSNIGAEIMQLKRKQLHLDNRLLNIISRLEISRTTTPNIRHEEMELAEKIDFIQRELDSPKEYKGRVNELLSHLRLIQNSAANSKYTIDDSTLQEARDFVAAAHISLQQMGESLKIDFDYLHLIMVLANDPKAKV